MASNRLEDLNDMLFNQLVRLDKEKQHQTIYLFSALLHEMYKIDRESED